MTLFVGIIPIISGYWKPIMTSLNRQFTCTCLCVNQLRMYSDAGVKPEKTSSESDVDTLAWEALVDYDKLSQDDLKIHQRHFQAVKVCLIIIKSSKQSLGSNRNYVSVLITC